MDPTERRRAAEAAAHAAEAEARAAAEDARLAIDLAARAAEAADAAARAAEAADARVRAVIEDEARALREAVTSALPHIPHQGGHPSGPGPDPQSSESRDGRGGDRHGVSDVPGVRRGGGAPDAGVPAPRRDPDRPGPDRAVPDRAVPDRAVPDRHDPDRPVPEHAPDPAFAGNVPAFAPVPRPSPDALRAPLPPGQAPPPMFAGHAPDPEVVPAPADNAVATDPVGGPSAPARRPRRDPVRIHGAAVGSPADDTTTSLTAVRRGVESTTTVLPAPHSAAQTPQSATPSPAPPLASPAQPPAYPASPASPLASPAPPLASLDRLDDLDGTVVIGRVKPGSGGRRRAGDPNRATTHPAPGAATDVGITGLLAPVPAEPAPLTVVPTGTDDATTTAAGRRPRRTRSDRGGWLRRRRISPVVVVAGAGGLLAIAAVVGANVVSSSPPSNAAVVNDGPVATPSIPLPAPAAAPPAEDAADTDAARAAAFMTALEDADVPTGTQDVDELAAADRVCADLDAGVAESTVVGNVPDDLPSVTEAQAADFVETARADYCV